MTDDTNDHLHTEHCIHEHDQSSPIILKIQLSNSGNEAIIEAIKKLQTRKDIVSVEPNYMGKMFVTTPNDVNLTTDWYIQKIELNKAWDISVGLSEVKVGVIDTGIDGTHRDLTNRVDSSLSVSYSPNSGNALQPGFFHGTWVAGIIGAQGNNGFDTSGVNWNVSLVSLRADGPAAGVPAANGRRAREPYEEDMDAVISSIIYAKNKSIPIVNFSGGFEFDSVALQTAVQSYQGLLVCASGNSNWNIDLAGSSIYPASYSYPNIISVSATTTSDTKTNYSNYGKTKVHLFAPGDNIRGSNMNGGVRTESGTSAAAPIVTGVAALIKAVNPNLTTAQIKSAILNNVDVVSGLSNYCITGGRLNAYKAISSVAFSTTTISGGISINGFISDYTMPQNTSISLPERFARQDSSTQQNLVAIGNSAFANQTQLTQITIPSTVTTIGSHAFQNTNNASIYLEGRTSAPSTFDINWNSSGNPVYLNGNLCPHSSTTLVSVNYTQHGHLCNTCRTFVSKSNHNHNVEHIPLGTAPSGIAMHASYCRCGHSVTVPCVSRMPHLPGDTVICMYCGQEFSNPVFVMTLLNGESFVSNAPFTYDMFEQLVEHLELSYAYADFIVSVRSNIVYDDYAVKIVSILPS